jgi:hypothetical protein
MLFLHINLFLCLNLGFIDSENENLCVKLGFRLATDLNVILVFRSLKNDANCRIYKH